jgi:hypothetical protein
VTAFLVNGAIGAGIGAAGGALAWAYPAFFLKAAPFLLGFGVGFSIPFAASDLQDGDYASAVWDLVGGLLVQRVVGGLAAAAVPAKAQAALRSFSQSFKSLSRSEKANVTTAVVAYSRKTGAMVLDVNGEIPSIIHPEMSERAAARLAAVGVKTESGNTIGRCAEFRSGNRLLLDDPSLTLDDVEWTKAIIPGKKDINGSYYFEKDYCDNCVIIFDLKNN